MTASRPITLTLLLVVAAGSWWLAVDHGSAPAVDAAAAPGTAGYYLNDATLEQTDASGRTTLVAHAAHAQQQDAGSSVTLDAPTVRFRTSAGREWLMTSDRGRLPADASVVELDGNVALHSAISDGAVVRTEHLELDVPAQVASTAEPVRIELPPHALFARGLHADLTQETLRLEGDVHGTFSR